MGINKKVKGLVKIIGIPAAFVTTGVSVLALLNVYQNHNVSYEIESKKVFQKADGIIGNTDVILNEDGSRKVVRYSALKGYRSYTDKNDDGIVDEVFTDPPLLARGGHSRSFYRDEHLNQYPKIFHEADLDFRKQIKRFKPYINR